ncbi:Oxygen-independent coproporphyrinogen-III oxidase [uncultured Roseburia sp.]|nr:Oxygen-independent coproporphyrinogen-III oxidase [uncultured Roseburia sp.]
MKKLELYVHIPFCVQKCSYCDFLSMPADSLVKQAYVRRLKEEIKKKAGKYKDRKVCSVFFGGGTPSILPTGDIRGILDCLRENFFLDREAEITVECNPGTLDAGKLKSYKHAGVNRLSMGLQSAENKELKLLGRIHTYEDFLESFDCARKCGFHNINVDLMSALPRQTLQSWERTLKKVVSLKPEHISAYSLIIEEGTPFYKIYGYDDETRQKGGQPLFLPTEEEEREMYRFTREFLAEKGYERYEISNYAKPGRQCIHNIGYWNRTDYLGLGIGASSLIDNCRFANEGSLSSYLDGTIGEEEPQKLTKQEQMEEFMFLGLRLMQGVSGADFLKHFSVSLKNVYGEVLQKLEGERLLEEHQGMIRLTEQGIDISNYVFSQFLMEE